MEEPALQPPVAVPPSGAPVPGGGASPGGVDVPHVETEARPSGFLPGLLRFFVVPMILVGASLAVFAGLGSLVARGEPAGTDLVTRIATGGKNARWQAAMELSNRVARGDLDLRASPDVVVAVADAFRRAREERDDPRVVRYLSLLLARSGDPDVRTLLEDAVVDADPDVRLYAVEALAHHRSPASAGVIAPRLSDTDPGVRTMAAFALGVVAEAGGAPARDSAGPLLTTALADPDLDVRWNAALALARLGLPAGEEEIWRMLHPDYVRKALAEGHGRPTGLLGAAARDPAPPEALEAEILRNALSALSRLRDRSMLDGVRALAADHPDAGVRDWAMRTREILDAEIRGRGSVEQRAWVPVAAARTGGDSSTARQE